MWENPRPSSFALMRAASGYGSRQFHYDWHWLLLSLPFILINVHLLINGVEHHMNKGWQWGRQTLLTCYHNVMNGGQRQHICQIWHSISSILIALCSSVLQMLLEVNVFSYAVNKLEILLDYEQQRSVYAFTTREEQIFEGKSLLTNKSWLNSVDGPKLFSWKT